MNSDELKVLLTIFRKARESLVNDFKSENIEIYDAMFRYEGNEKLMRISIDKYFISWLDSHFRIFDKLPDAISSDNLLKKFTEQMLILVKKTEQSIKNDDQIFSELLREKKEILGALLFVGNKADTNYKKLIYTHQKDNALFNRELLKLQREQS